MTEDKSLEDELRAAMSDTSNEPQELDQADDVDVPADNETGQDNTSEGADDAVQTVPVEPKDTGPDAPISLSGAIKAKWKELPEDVRAEWKKREDDIHRMMTARDGELNLGRTVKQIAAPYEAIIRAEGGTVEGAFADLLNTSYILRTGSPMQKAQAVAEAIQQFGVDLSLVMSGQQQNPLSAIQQEIQTLRQHADPNRIKSQLQEEMIRDRIADEIQAFAANPANVHFQAVKSTMGSLMASGRAKDLQEAYDMATWSDPSIRAELLNAQKAQEAEKKKAEMAAKKKASASVAGSPGLASPRANAPQQSLEDEIRASLRASSGKI